MAFLRKPPQTRIRGRVSGSSRERFLSRHLKGSETTSGRRSDRTARYTRCRGFRPHHKIGCGCLERSGDVHIAGGRSPRFLSESLRFRRTAGFRATTNRTDLLSLHCSGGDPPDYSGYARGSRVRNGADRRIPGSCRISRSSAGASFRRSDWRLLRNRFYTAGMDRIPGSRRDRSRKPRDD